ncbi:FAD:protein FMN transferase [Candidatus Cryosericum terrychapinii]|jgi:thiamine biosynthesis lipoprotein|uniref:FAD:protein FMN transferase n=1 Tax=Candidatus Cryosericum terrychapinii TaxID=2290919 RepID=A0A398D3Q1_9BACT|nr:FAD:protein FMN transferase [Candidatus Cryosericum terrychapinii]RIE05704.1 FAD:protein FMN transferase [Candidatus Cryosericum terrychapinii]
MTENMTAQSASFGMGTVITHRVFGGQTEEALQAAIGETVRLERMLSRFRSESEIGRINSSAGIRYEKVSSETFEVLSGAVEFSKCCQGSFDVTIGPLVTLWNIYEGVSEPPPRSRIEKAIPLVDYTDVAFDYHTKSVGLKKAGQSIDLGGIGKGYAADKVIDVFKKYGISSAFTNFGGNVATVGARPDGSPWRVGIQHPRQEDKLIGVVSVVNKSVVTSGDYQRYFIDSHGRRYHHILDPATGYPCETGLVSVTVVSDSSMAADALSTILFTVGMNRGIELLKSFPGTEAILIDMNLLVHVTRALRDCFQTTEGRRIDVLDN